MVRTSTRTNAAESTITTFILLTNIKFNTIALTSIISTTIMIIVIRTTISISVAVTITLPSIVVLIHIIMMNAVVAIIVTLVGNCIMNVIIITAGKNASISILAPVLLLSLLLLVRVPSSAHKLGFYYHHFYEYWY